MPAPARLPSVPDVPSSPLDEILDSASQPPAPRRKRGRRWVAAALALLLVAGVAAALNLGAGAPTGVRHYLLVGKDHWGEATSDDAGRTDVMLLITLDYDTPGLAMTSFLRDTLIDMPTGGQNRLNTLARKHGDAALREYVERTYGIGIEGMLSINFTGVVRVLDALGGVSVELTGAEAAYIRREVGDFAGEPPLHKGLCRLNGAQALSYMRCRKLDNDFGRANRQANVLSALMREAGDMTLGEALQAVPGIAACYSTDLSLGEQLELVRGAYALRAAPLRRHQIPAEGTYRYVTVKGASMLKINQEKNKALFDAFLAGE